MRKVFQLFLQAGEAAGAGAGAGTVDEKVAPSGGSPEGAKSAIQDEGANAKAAADKAAADKVIADKAAADKLAEDRKNETPEAKTAREAVEKKAADDAAALEAKKPKAPDKYELKVEKDAANFIDDEDLKLIEKVARANGLTNEQAQTLVDGRAGALLEQSAAFRAITEADTDLGGDKLDDTTRLVKVAMDKIYPTGTKDGDDFRKMLVKTGYGNNRLIVKHFRDLGRQMAEDSPGNIGGAAGGGEKDAASKLYDHPTSNKTGG